MQDKSASAAGWILRVAASFNTSLNKDAAQETRRAC